MIKPTTSLTPLYRRKAVLSIRKGKSLRVCGLLSCMIAAPAMAQDPYLPVVVVPVLPGPVLSANTPISILDLPPIVKEIRSDLYEPSLSNHGLNSEGFNFLSGSGTMLSRDLIGTGTLAQNNPVTGDAGQDNDGSIDATDKTMPQALTTPVLPNVPSSLQEGGTVAPGDVPTAQPAPAPSSTPDTSAPVNPNEADTKPEDPRSDSQQIVETPAPAESPARAQQVEVPVEDLSAHRPTLRQSLSVLYTEQRPFLLYAGDASITYLMPNAVVGNPQLSHYLRGILEERALLRWQEMREQPQETNSGAEEDSSAKGLGRPSLVITGRVEDRFSSSDYVSLYLEEQRNLGGVAFPNTIMSFNYDRKTNTPFGLADLFQNENEKTLQAVAQLLTAYIQADIVRQKSIRLGTPVTPQQDAWLKNMQPDLEFLSTFTLVPSRENGKIAGLRFHFNPGVLGAEADGTYDVYVPAAIFAPSLAEPFSDIFGGEALMASRHYATGFSTASVNLAGLRADADIGGEMLLEGEVPSNWCDGFHLSLLDKNSGQIVAEANVNKLPDVPTFGLANRMLRFRAEMSVPGNGGTNGQLVFEPYRIAVEDGRLQPRPGSACRSDGELTPPDPEQDMVSISVTY